MFKLYSNIEIKKVRMKEQNNQLLSISEEFFSLANDTVFKIENFSKEKSNYLMTLIIIRKNGQLNRIIGGVNL